MKSFYVLLISVILSAEFVAVPVKLTDFSVKRAPHEHQFVYEWCNMHGVCKLCGKQSEDYGPHYFFDGECGTPVVCRVCCWCELKRCGECDECESE